MEVMRFRPPNGQIIRVQYIKTHTDGSKTVLAIITENIISMRFYLYLPDEKGIFIKTASNSTPDFKEVQHLYDAYEKASTV